MTVRWLPFRLTATDPARASTEPHCTPLFCTPSLIALILAFVHPTATVVPARIPPETHASAVLGGGRVFLQTRASKACPHVRERSAEVNNSRRVRSSPQMFLRSPQVGRCALATTYSHPRAAQLFLGLYDARTRDPEAPSRNCKRPLATRRRLDHHHRSHRRPVTCQVNCAVCT